MIVSLRDLVEYEEAAWRLHSAPFTISGQFGNVRIRLYANDEELVFTAANYRDVQHKAIVALILLRRLTRIRSQEEWLHEQVQG